MAIQYITSIAGIGERRTIQDYPQYRRWPVRNAFVIRWRRLRPNLRIVPNCEGRSSRGVTPRDAYRKTVRNFVCGQAVEHYAAMARMKRSPKTTANWALASNHSRGGIFHCFSDRFKSHIYQRKPHRRAMPRRIARANAKRSAIRSAVEHVFAGQKHRMGLIVRTIGITRARIKIGLAILAYNFQRLAWLEGRTAPA